MFFSLFPSLVTFPIKLPLFPSSVPSNDFAEPENFLLYAWGVSVVVSASDVSTLLVEGSGLVRQPPGDMVIVTKDLIVYTDPSSRTLSTTVGGTPVSVVVTPVSYRWDWGDGTSTTTRDPGAAYPHQTVVHRYRELLQGMVVTLTTTWSATFSVEGGPPQPVSSRSCLPGAGCEPRSGQWAQLCGTRAPCRIRDWACEARRYYFNIVGKSP